MLDDTEILAVVTGEERAAIGYIYGEESEISTNRKKLLNYYNSQPYGDEIDGQSQVVTSDVADVVEGMLPSMLRTFTQGRYIARFEADDPNYDQEAKEKTILANHIFQKVNDGVLILHDMFKDALLQYTGAVKIIVNDYEAVRFKKYEGLSDDEKLKLELDETVDILSEELEDEGWEVEVRIKTPKKRYEVVNVPPEELLINRDARSFIDPRFIGQRVPKTKSELIQMGFDQDIIEELSSEDEFQISEIKQVRNHDLNWSESNPTPHPPNDKVFLGEYYMKIDIDGDGVAELWQIFTAGNQILEKNRVDEHPFAVCVPIPIPHRAIGSCPAEQVADIQFVNTTLTRQALNNIYHTNFARTVVNDRIDLDDLLTPRAAGIVVAEGKDPVTGSLEQINTVPIVQEILGMVEYIDSKREMRTGVTRYNQGLDTESLNKTATGFQGIKDMSQMRMDMIARVFADGGVKQIFEKIINAVSTYQDEPFQLNVLGQPLEIDPRRWSQNLRCRIDVGIGAGDRLEKVQNLNFLLQISLQMMEKGLPVTDSSKVFRILDKSIEELNLGDGNYYFNNPERPDQLLMAENEYLKGMVGQLQQMAQNPLADVEKIRAQAKIQTEQIKQDSDMTQFLAKMKQDNEQFKADIMTKLTEMELKYKQNVPGSAV